MKIDRSLKELLIGEPVENWIVVESRVGIRFIEILPWGAPGARAEGASRIIRLFGRRRKKGSALDTRAGKFPGRTDWKLDGFHRLRFIGQ